MSHTRRIYNNAKQWFKIKVTSWSDGYEDAMFYIRNDGYHPYKQYETFHCRCRWCRPKESEKGAVRVQRKAYIRRELMNI